MGPGIPLSARVATGGAATVVTPPGTVEPHGAQAAAGSTTTTPARLDAQAALPDRQTPTPRRGRTAAADPGKHILFAPHDVGILPGADVLPVVHSIVTRSVSHPEMPLGLALVVSLFLLVQHRIDRRDPKLAHAPREEPAALEFGSAITFA